MKVKDLIDKLQQYDKNMTVVGVNSVKTGFIDKSEVVCSNNSYCVKSLGKELAVIIV